MALAGTPASAAPTIFWANDPVGPDDSVVVSGDSLLSVTGLRLTVESVGKAPQPARTVPLQQVTATSLKFTIPGDFPSGIYHYELMTADGSASGRLNAPTVYWTAGDLGDSASQGGWIRVLGRNIRRSQDAKLILSGPGGDHVLPVAVGDLWDAHFVVPRNFPAGVYRLALNNGEGGESDSIGTLAIQAAAAATATPAPNFDVRSHGALGDGVSDDSEAFQAALNAAGEAALADHLNVVVSVPAGRYLITKTLVVPPGVTFRGEATDRVALVWPDRPDVLDALVSGRTNFTIENLSLYASNHGHLVVGGFEGDEPIANAADITIRNVRIRASAFRGHMTVPQTAERMAQLDKRFPRSPSSLRLSGRRILVENCDVVGSGGALVLVAARDAHIIGNRLANGRYGWYSLTASARVIVEKNEISALDLQGTGGGVNTLARDQSTSENILFRDNTFHDMYGWDREALTGDGPGGYYFGSVQSARLDQLSLTDALPNPMPTMKWEGATVFVVAGGGVGQWARVAAWQPPGSEGAGSGGIVTLERPLQVPVNPSTRVTIVQTQRNYLIIGNTFVDTGVAAQTYGTALDEVMADNVSVRTGGFIARGSFYRHFQPNWHIQMLDNRITEGNIYRAGSDHGVFSGRAVVAARGLPPAMGKGQPEYARWIVIRGNVMKHDAQIELTGKSASSPGLRDVIVEHNQISPDPDAIVIDAGVAGALVRANPVTP